MKRIAFALMFLVAMTLVAAADSFSFMGFIGMVPASGGEVIISWPRGGRGEHDANIQDAKVGNCGGRESPPRGDFIIVGVEVSTSNTVALTPLTI